MTPVGKFTDVKMFLNTKPAPADTLSEAEQGALANLRDNAGVPNYRTMTAAELHAFVELQRRKYIRCGAWGQYHVVGECGIL